MTSAVRYQPGQIDADLHEAWIARRDAYDALRAKDTPAHRLAWREARRHMDDVLDRMSK